MYEPTAVSDIVSMAILNLEVVDFNRLVQLKEINTLDYCCVPILGINDIIRCNLGCINPAFAFDLEGMRFGTPDNFAVNIELNETVNLVDRSRDNSLFCRFAGDMIDTRDNVADLIDIIS